MMAPDRKPPSGELIERLQRRRTRLLFFQAIVFLLWQTTLFGMRAHDRSAATPSPCSAP
ncbi:hypothetical protein [Phenylobacterium sp.]|uniref:hypothetical protein n=1 Tax=Phenylobacterium sp. TaxID=1871053 RepID=UPI00356B226E